MSTAFLDELISLSHVYGSDPEYVLAGGGNTSLKSEEFPDGLPADLLTRTVEQIPIGRAGTPDDVAALVAFLCSADADYLTGQVVELHGGMGVTHPAHQLSGWGR